MITSEYLHQFKRIACAMSPENLHRDGEATKEEVMAQTWKLRQEWAALEKEVGRPVTEEEIFCALSKNA